MKKFKPREHLRQSQSLVQPSWSSLQAPSSWTGNKSMSKKIKPREHLRHRQSLMQASWSSLKAPSSWTGYKSSIKIKDQTKGTSSSSKSSDEGSGFLAFATGAFFLDFL
jgi:hypothetical protein